LVIIALLGLGITGCGSKKTSSQEQGSTADKLTLTIVGQVNSGVAEPYTDVKIEIGDLKLSAKTDASGQYRKTLEVDHAHASFPIKISAGIDPTRQKLILLTMLDSASSLTQIAGPDKTLTADENSLVDLTFYSTATFGQLREIDNMGIERVLDTDEKMHRALSSLKLDDTLRFATILYLAIHGSGFNLPVIDNTLLYISREGTSAYDNALKLDPALVNKIKFEMGNKYRIWSAPISPLGEIIVYMRSTGNSYKISFNADLTGVLNQNLKFKWRLAQDNKAPAIVLDFEKIDPSEPDESIKLLLGLGVQSAQLLFANDFAASKRGQLFFYSAPSVQIQETTLPINDNIFTTPSYESPDCYFYPTAQLAAVMPANLLGKWFQQGESLEFLSLTFLNNNQVAVERFVNHSGFKLPYGEDVHKVRQASWSIMDNKLVFSSPGATETYWFMEDLGYGYSYLKQTEEYFTVDGINKYVFVFDKGTLFKQQEIINPNKEDFAGIWASEDGIRVLQTSGAQYLDFGHLEQPWSFNGTKDSWQTAKYIGVNHTEESCDSEPVDPTRCELARTDEFFLFAISGSSYFYLTETTPYSTSLNPLYVDGVRIPTGTEGTHEYSFKVLKKSPNIKYFGRDWMAYGKPKTFYQKTATGQNIWLFNAGKLTIGEETVEYRFEDQKLHYFRNGTARELKLIAADMGGLRVCEYDEGAVCKASDEFYLSNQILSKQ
jgi:hypothetical protein